MQICIKLICYLAAHKRDDERERVTIGKHREKRSLCTMRIMMMMMMILMRSRLHMVLFDFPSSHTLQEHQKENEHTQFRSATG